MTDQWRFFDDVLYDRTQRNANDVTRDKEFPNLAWPRITSETRLC